MVAKIMLIQFYLVYIQYCFYLYSVYLISITILYHTDNVNIEFEGKLVSST